MVRVLVFLAALLFILGFALLAALYVKTNGLTPAAVVGICILVVIGVGVLGALIHPPRR